MSGASGPGGPWTVRRLLEWTVPFFQKKGIESARLDAELLLCAVLQCPRLDLYTNHDRPLEQSELDAFRALVQRRGALEPVAYLVGSKGFHEIELKVDKRVLIPRPETEMLVEQGRTFLSDLGKQRDPKKIRLLDLGTGSGAIVLSLLYVLPDLTAVATDISPDALAVAESNARRLGLEGRVDFRQGGLFEPVKGLRFDAVLSNPPYVADDAELSPEVVDYEPKRALFAGADGLRLLSSLVAQASEFLLPGGLLAIEFGIGQREGLAVAAKQAGFAAAKFHDDLNGIPRMMEAYRWTP